MELTSLWKKGWKRRREEICWTPGCDKKVSGFSFQLLTGNDVYEHSQQTSPRLTRAMQSVSVSPASPLLFWYLFLKISSGLWEIVLLLSLRESKHLWHGNPTLTTGLVCRQGCYLKDRCVDAPLASDAYTHLAKIKALWILTNCVEIYSTVIFMILFKHVPDCETSGLSKMTAADVNEEFLKSLMSCFLYFKLIMVHRESRLDIKRWFPSINLCLCRLYSLSHRLFSNYPLH